MGALPVRARYLILFVSSVGVALLFWAGAAVVQAPAILLVGTAAAIGMDALWVEVGRYSSQHKAAVSLDILGVFFMLALFGPAGAVVVALLNSLVNGLLSRSPLFKVGYNAGINMCAAYMAAMLVSSPLPWHVGAPLSAVVFYAINTLAVALIIAIVSGRQLLPIWRESFAWVTLQQLSLAVAGYVLGLLVGSFGWMALLVALPLPMLRFTYVLYAQATQRHTQELEELSSELITTLAAVVDARDAYTFGHSTQVARYSVAMAQRLRYGPDGLKRLERSALLHDIGKVGIPERILFKPGRLTPEEYETMKSHTTIGHDIIKRIRPLQDAAGVALHHHERWNGSGYPFGKRGEEIDLDSRIVGVADTLETMISDRPYRRGCTLSEALAEIDRGCGTLFDPAVVKALHQVIAENGTSFFVNSALLVQELGSKALHWSPGGNTQQVAASRDG